MRIKYYRKRVEDSVRYRWDEKGREYIAKYEKERGRKDRQKEKE